MSAIVYRKGSSPAKLPFLEISNVTVGIGYLQCRAGAHGAQLFECPVAAAVLHKGDDRDEIQGDEPSDLPPHELSFCGKAEVSAKST